MKSDGLRTAGGAAAIALLALVAYAPALRAGFVWDDDAYVTRNAAVADPAGLGRIWFDLSASPQYYPLVFTSFWIEHKLWGFRPAGYHVDNVLLHVCGALLLWRVLQRLDVPGAWLAAAVFALHPVHVESVAWITERKNVLSGVFFFAAMLAYFRFAERRDSSRAANSPAAPPRGMNAAARGRRTGRWYAAALLLFLCALLSKTSTVVLPPVLLLLAWWKTPSGGGDGRTPRRDADIPHEDARTLLRDVLPLLPMFAAAVGAGLLTAWVERHQVGAAAESLGFSFVERCLLAGRVAWFYAGKLLWPVDITFIYPRWRIDASAALPYLFPAAALLLVAGLGLLRRRLGRGPLVAVLCFGGGLAPVMGFVDVYYMQRYSFVADHFQYLPSAALIALAVGGAGGRAGGAVQFFKRAWPSSFGGSSSPPLQGGTGGGSLSRRARRNAAASSADPRAPRAALEASGGRDARTPRTLAVLSARAPRALAALLVVVLAALTWRECRAYANIESLWTDVLRKNPGCALACNNLALLRSAQGRRDEELDFLERAVALDPRFVEARMNLTARLLEANRTDEAIEHARIIVRQRPNQAAPRHALGVALARAKRFDEAAEAFRKAAALNPSETDSLFLLGNALFAAGRHSEAAEAYRRTLQLAPDYPGARDMLSRAESKAASAPAR